MLPVWLNISHSLGIKGLTYISAPLNTGVKRFSSFFFGYSRHNIFLCQREGLDPTPPDFIGIRGTNLRLISASDWIRTSDLSLMKRSLLPLSYAGSKRYFTLIKLPFSNLDSLTHLFFSTTIRTMVPISA